MNDQCVLPRALNIVYMKVNVSMHCCFQKPCTVRYVPTTINKCMTVKQKELFAMNMFMNAALVISESRQLV